MPKTDIEKMLPPLLVKLKRSQEPTSTSVDILYKIIDLLSGQHLTHREMRMELLLTIQDLVDNCFEDNSYAETTIAHCEHIAHLLTATQVPAKSAEPAAVQPALPTKKQPELVSRQVGSQTFEAIVDAYKSKWKLDRQAGHPGLRAKNSNVSKKLLKSLAKHEEYILKTLQTRWLTFERKLDKIKDAHCVSVELQRMCETLRQASPAMGIADRDEESINRRKTDEQMVKAVHPKVNTVEKYFKDIDQVPANDDVRLETVVSIAGVRECYINFGQLWKGDDSRWLSIKHNLVQRGVMMSNGLYVSLPIYRTEFELGHGNFGTVEFAFSKNFHGVALKRLTESGHLSTDRCDGIRRTIEKIDRQLASVMLTAQPNVLRMTAFQDMCGYSFVYTRLCDYNLNEYLRALKERNNDDDNVGLLSSEWKEFLIGQIVRGLCALHVACQPAVVHGNLKPTNVLVDAGGTVKLTDFGVHKYLYKNQTSISEGDQLWWPPEIHTWFKLLKSYTCSTMSDVYTCALLMLYVYTEGKQIKVESMASTIEPIVAADMYTTLHRMLSVDPLKRPAINEVQVPPTSNTCEN